MSVESLRGTQVQIGKLSFHFPEAPPVSDEDIIEREEIIARIAAATAPHEDIVQLGKQVTKSIQADITKTMKRRLLEEDEPSLFDYADTETEGDDEEDAES